MMTKSTRKFPRLSSRFATKRRRERFAYAFAKAFGKPFADLGHSIAATINKKLADRSAQS